MTWAFVNIVASSVVASIIALKLIRWPGSFTPPERVGMGLLGAGCILTIGPLMSQSPTPFEDWSATLMRLGCAIYFIGRMLRHRYNNWSMQRAARDHFSRKGP